MLVRVVIIEVPKFAPMGIILLPPSGERGLTEPVLF